MTGCCGRREKLGRTAPKLQHLPTRKWRRVREGGSRVLTTTSSDEYERPLTTRSSKLGSKLVRCCGPWLQRNGQGSVITRCRKRSWCGLNREISQGLHTRLLSPRSFQCTALFLKRGALQGVGSDDLSTPSSVPPTAWRHRKAISPGCPSTDHVGEH